MTQAQLPPGSVVDGRYVLGSVVRTRTGATVYAATDPDGQPVHVTVYATECFPSLLVLERGLRELRQLQNVNAPQLLRVLACGKAEGGGLYEVNEAIEMPPLEERIHGQKISPAEAAHVVLHVGEALQAAQMTGVIHRNVGAHVVFTDGARVKVGGFVVGEPQGGTSFGSLETLAPEQVEGKVVDQRTLIYNLAALMHQMLTGTPLFTGDAAAQLQQHVSADPPQDVHPTLRRALSKDARMRPMMLKQFLSELAAIGGVDPAVVLAPPQAPTPSQPSTRGWTMFMDASQVTQGAAASPAVPPYVAAPATSPTAAVPAPATSPTPPPGQGGSGPASPPTRGWTMFMDASAVQPEAAGAAAPPSAGTVPSASTPAPAPDAGPPKPSTRGWTMFMDASEVEASAAARSAAGTIPAAPVPETPVQTPPAQAAGTEKPSTRGWTMFMDASEVEQPPQANPQPPIAAAPVPVTSAPVQASTPGAAESGSGAPSPSTRGWTMFMEPGVGGSAGQAPAPSNAAQSPSPTPAAPAGGSSTRGWTMFMDAPLPDKQGTPEQGLPDPSAGATPSPPVGGTSDAKGWTVFMDRNAAPAGAPGGAGEVPSPTRAPGPQDTAGKRTVIAGSMTPPVAAPMASSVAAGRTVFASAPPQKPQHEIPDTMYFKRGETEPERSSGVRRVTVDEVEAPSAPMIAEERHAPPMQYPPVAAPMAPGRAAPVSLDAERSGGKIALVLIVVLVAGAAAAFFFLGGA